jgi:TolA-binding protein
MSDDLLERATRALREESAPSANDLAETRARLLASSTTKKARRTNALRWVLPMAAAFAAGTALAATNGGLERAVRAVQTWLVEASVSETPAPKAKRARRRPDSESSPVRGPDAITQVAPAVAPEPPTAPAVPEATPQAVEPVTSASPMVSGRERSAASRALREVHRPSASEGATASAGVATSGPGGGQDDALAEQGVSPTESATTKPALAPSPDLALYREAHRSHFVARDHAEALSLWNAYLARFPSGIFTLEARYNRAICLVHLGRKQEAETALVPFAEGQFKAAYRQDDARALLDALRKKP